MDIPEEKQYVHLTSHLRYLNEKIMESFTLFIKLASAIIGGVFFLHWKLDWQDLKRNSFGHASDLLFILVSISMVLLILNNLRSWHEYRRTLSEQYPDIPLKRSLFTSASEALMCLIIAATCIGFLVFNPL